MTDYFSEYSSFMGAAKGLPSPGDTPYETPGYIRSKRSSRATTGSSRAPSESPPPLPPDMTEVTEKSRDGRYGALDPHRFTPTLHASLVSEILNLRRELDSKIGLVESLETTVSQQKNENEGLNDRLSQNARETRKVKQQVQLIEKGTNDAVEDYAKERDIARANADDLRSKLENAQKTVRRQDEDAERTQRIWEAEKESWDSERRQLERRVHVTESRLRTVVDEMSAQQAVVEAQQLHLEEIDESLFKDSGLGNESDNGSIRSVTPVKHKRNRSSLSSRSRSVRYSTASRRTGTPEPQAKTGYSLADELGIDEEDEYDMDEFEHPDDELDHAEHLRRTIQSRNSSVSSELGSKAKRILGLTTENVDVPPSPTVRDLPKRSMDSATVSERSEPIKESLEQPTILPTLHEVISTPRLQYVDTGYQPSPPPSPLRDVRDSEAVSIPRIEEPVQQSTTDSGRESQSSQREVTARVVTPISLPDSPIIEDATTAEVGRASNGHPSYSTASTQTEFLDSEHHKNHTPKRDSLSPAVFVPAIAIHPPSSRPSSPRTYALPPGTKNASTQANIPWAYRDAFVQTEAIRVDKRLVKLPSHVPSGSLLPSPTFQQPLPPPSTKRAAIGGIAKIFTKIVPAQPTPSPPLQSPKETISETSRNTSEKNLRSMPLKVIPLPRPVLSPPLLQGETFSQGPLNRSASYGVSTNPGQRSSQLFELDKESDNSDNEDVISDFDTKDLEGSIPALYRPPAGRFALSKPPKVVPEDTEISPERRPGTAESYGAAPAPSIASSRANSVSKRAHNNPPTKLGAYNKGSKPRSPSFGSIASSNYSTQSVAPPFPIPTRSSSRVVPNSHSEGSQSPTPNHTDVFGNRAGPSRRTQHGRQPSLRKVQSAAVIRHPARRVSPQKSRRRRRHSPDLTPVQSMAFESPAPTNFPIPELPTPMYDNTSATFDLVKGSMDVGRRSDAAASSVPRASDVETNLVDAIAGTMVGEWMWKYVRKRKSFGVQEDFPVAADGSVDTSVSGSRHKRWVWLSPYERTIMWDSKQPATGTALLGKKGRKLAIQSVTDVVDRTALPKGPELRTAHNRSILILTPSRALKFTTVSSERHGLWMTALSFLAQSGRLPSQIPPLPTPPIRAAPPIPSQDSVQLKRDRSPSFGRAKVRDSVRLAKGKRPDLPKSASQPGFGHSQTMPVLEEFSQNDESADFPAVPRLYSSTARHRRKRSNTSPRLPPPLSGFRSISSSAIPSSSSSGLHPASTFRPQLPSASSRSGSRQGSVTSPDRPNFFEAVGTVRMEAFVDPSMKNGVLYVPPPPLVDPAAGPRRSRGDSNNSQSTWDKRRCGYIFDEFGRDPFKNF